MPLDLDALAAVISDAVKVATAPLMARIAVLEQAKEAAPAIDVDGIVSKAAALVPVPKDGRDAVIDYDVIALKAATLVPVPKDGRDAVVDLDALALKAASLIPVPANGKDGRDGADLTVDDLSPVIVAEVTKAVAAIPRPHDGKDAVVDLDALAVKAAALVPRPKDGADGAPGRDGRDGVQGIQGERGQDGKDGELGPIGQPGPKGDPGERGERGADGLDGLGFDDMDLVYDETQKVVAIEVRKGDRVKQRIVPIPIDCGVYSDHETYRKGHMVSRGGSMWIALLDSIKGIRPDDATDDGRRAWRLCVQRGKAGKQGQQGPPGSPGQDLRWERE